MDGKRLVLLSILVSLSFAVSSASHADEGMFLPDQVPFKVINKKYGVDLTREKIDTWSQGTMKVYMGGGYGSGSFISPEGLVFTNHHVAYDCVQSLRAAGTIPASSSHPYAFDSYLSPTQVDEPHCPNYELHVTLSIIDVTEQVLSSGGTQEENSARLIKGCEVSYTGAVCEIKPVPSANAFLLHAQRRHKDVRLVYAPSVDLGMFGDFAFNFQFPRYAGDFAFLRAYAKPDGSVADQFAPDNIPLNTTSVYLKPNLESVKEGDFVMVMGYPGGTNRIYSNAEMTYKMNHHFPLVYTYLKLKAEGIQTAIDQLESSDDPEVRSHVEELRSDHFSFTNSEQYYQGVIEGGVRSNIVETSQKRDAQLAKAIAKNEALQRQYGDMFPTLEGFYTDMSEAVGSLFLVLLSRTSLIQPVQTLLTIVRENAKPEEERMPAEKLDELINSIMVLGLNVSLEDREFLKRYFDYLYSMAHTTPAVQVALQRLEQQLELDPSAQEGAMGDVMTSTLIEKAVIFSNVLARFVLLMASEQDLKDLHDPLIDLALYIEEVKSQRDSVLARESLEVPPNLARLQAALAQTGIQAALPYYDANRTWRFTYGQVLGYTWGEDVIDCTSCYEDIWTTRLNGQNVIDLLSNRDCVFAGQCIEAFGDTTVNFVSTLDITGGNSGSAALNQYGEVVGAVFDSTWEGMLNDYIYSEAGAERSVTVTMEFAIKYTEWDLQRHGWQVKDTVVDEVKNAASSF